MKRNLAFIRGFFYVIFLTTAVQSCVKEVPESVHDLCTGYWLTASQNANSNGNLLLFDKDGDVSNYVCRYEENDDSYYAYYEASIYDKYLIDVENANMCFLPDAWYRIDVLSNRLLVLTDSDAQEIVFSKVLKDRVKIVPKTQFTEIFPGYIEKGEK